MFFKVVSEKAAFDWLLLEKGDSQLLLASDPLPWQSSLLWVERVDNRREFLLFWREYLKMPVNGVCWHAGHEQTLKIGLRLADFNCGRKFIALRSLHPENWQTPRLCATPA